MTPEEMRQRTKQFTLRVMKVVAERGDGVEAVVAAGQFDDDEDGVLGRLRVLVGGAGGGGQELGNNAAHGEQAAAAERAGEEVAARGHERLRGWASVEP